MKLLRIINKRYAYFSVIILLSGIVIIYFFLQYFINQETLEKLQNTKQDVVKSLDRGITVEFYPMVDIKELPQDYNGNVNESITDTTIFNSEEDEPDSYKQISFIHTSGSRKFLVYVRTDNLETSDIILPLGLPAFFLILSILLVSNIIINRINFKIWNPFYKNLDRLKNFSASDKDELQLTKSEIDEFSDLNNSLAELTNRIRNDYRHLKEFSENASHELQTPLSIIKVKIESMMQDENLDRNHLDKIQSIYRMINRLSRLNKSLTLLSKLESIEYEKKSEISLEEFITKKINDFSEIAEANQLTIKTNFYSDKIITVNSDLLEILFSNLLSNAIRYNIENGIIEISLSGDELAIKNSGNPPKKDTQKMFERFEKGEQSEESSGLGLTIVKQICSANKFDIQYTFENQFHIIRITLSQ